MLAAQPATDPMMAPPNNAPQTLDPRPGAHAYVYKSLRRADTYVYLAARDDFGRLPEPLRTQLGALAFVLDVALTPERRLAREDIDAVRANLAARGFHLQFPPGSAGEPSLGAPGMHGRDDDWGTDA